MSDQQALERRRDRAVAVLAVGSGATDALGFIALGGAFTSVMTGNMVLTGVGLASSDLQLLLLAAGAIAAFCAGCAVGAWLAGSPQEGDPVWPRPVTLALAVQLTVTAAFAAGWWTSGGDPGEGAALGLLALNALGLGIQSSAVQRLGVSGLSTTYLTGTLTSFVIDCALRRRTGSRRRSGLVLTALVAGAALGAVLTQAAPVTAPGLLLGSLLVVIALSRFGLRVPTSETDAATPLDGPPSSSAKYISYRRNS